LRSGVLLFSQSKLVVTYGKGFPTVIGAEPVEAFPLLRTDFQRMTYASYAAELLEQTIAERHPDDEVFRLILQEFYLLEHIEPWIAILFLEQRLLSHMGYPVQLENCQNCNQQLSVKNSHNNNLYRGVHGGVVCKHCGSIAGSVVLDRECITVWKALETIPAHRLDRVFVSRHAKELLERYVEFQLQQILSRPLKSRDFLKQVGL